MKPKTFISHSTEETKHQAALLAGTIRGGITLCLQGGLGAGKTTFAQGLLEALHAEKPYTSPTFIIMKQYDLPRTLVVRSLPQHPTSGIRRIYHVDAYRVDAGALENLGWDEWITDQEGLVLVEWPERIAQLLPQNARRVELKWVDEQTREITLL